MEGLGPPGSDELHSSRFATEGSSKSSDSNAWNNKPPRDEVWRLIVNAAVLLGQSQSLGIVDQLRRRFLRFKLGADLHSESWGLAFDIVRHNFSVCSSWTVMCHRPNIGVRSNLPTSRLHRQSRRSYRSGDGCHAYKAARIRDWHALGIGQHLTGMTRPAFAEFTIPVSIGGS